MRLFMKLACASALCLGVLATPSAMGASDMVTVKSETKRRVFLIKLPGSCTDDKNAVTYKDSRVNRVTGFSTIWNNIKSAGNLFTSGSERRQNIFEKTIHFGKTECAKGEKVTLAPKKSIKVPAGTIVWGIRDGGTPVPASCIAKKGYTMVFETMKFKDEKEMQELGIVESKVADAFKVIGKKGDFGAICYHLPK